MQSFMLSASRKKELVFLPSFSSGPTSISLGAHLKCFSLWQAALDCVNTAQMSGFEDKEALKEAVNHLFTSFLVFPTVDALCMQMYICMLLGDTERGVVYGTLAWRLHLPEERKLKQSDTYKLLTHAGATPELICTDTPAHKSHLARRLSLQDVLLPRLKASPEFLASLRDMGSKGGGDRAGQTEDVEAAHLLSLPLVFFDRLFTFLPLNSLLSLRLVCRDLDSLVKECAVWAERTRLHFPFFLPQLNVDWHLEAPKMVINKSARMFYTAPGQELAIESKPDVVMKPVREESALLHARWTYPSWHSVYCLLRRWDRPRNKVAQSAYDVGTNCLFEQDDKVCKGDRRESIFASALDQEAGMLYLRTKTSIMAYDSLFSMGATDQQFHAFSCKEQPPLDEAHSDAQTRLSATSQCVVQWGKERVDVMYPDLSRVYSWKWGQFFDLGEAVGISIPNALGVVSPSSLVVPW
eukprot:CAMPEP_0177634930 /NCGR_PEP_ID=MMETSP0447-20121125/3630_1 /TAXON_ID=0 /ORGANISM="Stygamoeba regulata, Strain BSH-02190019" /LENGTH=466 /DNA_ID=CAMNT_0019136683 /DNA_START=326 /DNA_END=1723 /DNA_ORIENTATION=+